jgi:hypothetical protein
VEKGDLEGARALYNEAAGIEPYCVEAIFNLGLVNLRLGDTQASDGQWLLWAHWAPHNRALRG